MLYLCSDFKNRNNMEALNVQIINPKAKPVLSK